MTRRKSGRIHFYWTAVRAAIKFSDWARRVAPVMLLIGALFVGTAVRLTWSASAHVWERKSWNRLFGSSAQSPSGGASARIERPEESTAGGTFTTIDITGAGTGAGTGTIAGFIDTAGDVAGVYLDGNEAAHSFLRTADGAVTPIDAPLAGTGATQGTFALSIDSTGNYVTGMYADSNNVYHGFLFQTANDTLTTLDVAGAGTTGHRGTIALGVNSAGTVVGTYITGSYLSQTTYYYGFVQTLDGTVTTIDAPDAGTGNQEGTLAMNINASGEIAGLFFATKQVPFGFVRDTAGTLTEFGVDCQGSGITGCYATVPTSIDAAGDVTGTSRSGLTANSVSLGFVRTANGTITTFNPTGSVAGSSEFTGTLPFGIDPGGNYITGFYSDSNGEEHGFVRSTSDGTITSFDAPGAATTLTFLAAGTGGFSVNASGQIAGTYVDSSSVFHGFLLTPAAAAQAAAPTFSPTAGTYPSAQNVTISDATSGATIYYTTNGTTPTVGASVYSGPITVSSSETVEAIAAASGFTNSAVASAAYTINITANPAPVLGSLSPAFTSSGGSAFTLTIAGTGFISGSTVYWGSTALATAYVSTTQLTAQVLAGDIASSGTTAITVQTPSPGGGTSNTLEFEVDSGSSGSGPTFTTLTATVAPGSSAAYPVTLPSSASNVTVVCLNLPAGASCSYSANSGSVTITTSSSTPAGTYQITVVFTETLPGAATALIFLPILLLPLIYAPRRWAAASRVWLLACAAAVLTMAVLITSCGGGSSASEGGTSPQTHTITSSGTVTLIVQ